jgi:hypothetical protein
MGRDEETKSRSEEVTKWLSKSMMLVVVWGAASVVSLVGCAAIDTPDGHKLRMGNRQPDVEKALGPADLIETGSTWDDNPREQHFYLRSGYSLWFRDGALAGMKKIEPSERADVERRARVAREVVPLVQVGTYGPNVIELFGEPDAVEDVRIEQGLDKSYRGRYDRQFEREKPPERIWCYFFKRDVAVLFESGRVTRVKPMAAGDAARMGQYVAEQRESNGEAGERAR